jgi:predicted phage terminase large subunit-like protein
LKRNNIHALAVDPDGEKTVRMSAQTTRIKAGCVSLPRKAYWLDEFHKEISALPSGRHNNQVDCIFVGPQRSLQSPAPWRIRGGDVTSLLY